ncbi:MAG TPA: efflux RND transporter permease subunit [Candidatus Angelobacter sp.]|jgi:multidrug efflux pump subunit AcrB|nr:efflux RND transporter permease subunit [Candidatus Angelobacter sp.]
MADELDIKNGAQATDPWLVRNSKSVIFVIIVGALVGVYLSLSVPVSVFPSTDFPRIVIGVDSGVMPIDQMMVTITRPLEQAVNSVPGLEVVRSITSRGTAEIDLFFNWQVDMFQTLQLVDAALSKIQTELPPGTRIESHRLTFASFPILGYSLTSDKVPQTQLWELATYQIAPRLNRMTGVATVVVQGGQEPEFHIVPDPAKLLEASVTVTDILNAVKQTNLIDSPGLFGENHQLVLGLVNGQARSAADIEQTVIKNTPAGLPVRIRDVAQVQEAVKPVYTVVRAEGKPAVLLNINRQPDSNTVIVANEVHAEVDRIRSTLPPGVQLVPWYDQSGIVQDSIKSVRDAILLGLLLSAIVLILFLHDWGSSIVAGLVIPVTILVTFIVLKLLGQSFNLMTLGGLAAAVGLVIDDAIVVVENIVLHRDSGQGKVEAAKSALSEITVPLIGSTLTPIVVFLPLITMTGVNGSFFRALAVTMCAALLTSLVLALSWTPTLSLYLLRREPASGVPEVAEQSAATDQPSGIHDKSEEMRKLMAAEEASMKGFFSHVIQFYERWLRRALEHPRWLLALAALLIVISGACALYLGSDLLPGMDEGGFIVDYLMPPGSSLEETNRVVSHVEAILHDIPEVESTSRRTGLQLGLAAVTEANTGDISVKLKAKRKRSADEIIDDVRTTVKKEEPRIDIDVKQLLQDMIGDLTGAPEAVVIKMFSEDANLLSQTAPRVADAISKIDLPPGKPKEGDEEAGGTIVDLKNGIENITSGPAQEFRVAPGVAARAGFTAEEVSTDATALLQGVPATTPLVANNRAYTIRVRFPEQNRSSQDAMSNTLLVSSTGKTATLGSLAQVNQIPGQTEIIRENLQRLVEVTARLKTGESLGTGMAKVQKVVAGMHLPPSIRVTYGGLYEQQQKDFHDMAIVLVLAVVLVFTVLLFEFRNFSAPIAILSSALLSISGVFLALLVTGKTINLASIMGAIMVIGIVAKNGILLLDAHDKFENAGFEPEEAMIQAGRRRLRPIFMTALATIAGMLPLSLALGAGSQMLQPLAIAVIGGIMISMVLSLIVTPVVFFSLRK